MKKKIAILAAAALMAGTGTFALAQGTAPANPAGPGTAQENTTRPERRGMSQDDFNRFVDARIAGIKAGLRLTPEQERLWQPVEDAIRSNANERFTRMEQRRSMRGQDRQEMDFMQRLERRGTMMTERAQRTSALATAMRPLWNSFNDDQKRVAPRLLRTAVGGMGWRGHHGGRHHGRDHARMGMHQGHGMMHRGPGMMQRQGGGDQQQAPAQPQNQQ
ncbi:MULTISPECIES: Spy/CpxP family protein refolding chaperone [Microvirga]|uniref:Spy/CpxP family protein refolding chaperone n=1 Tax=Microvirga TaxID=186650 RepID=UPI001CFF8EE5|nr:Spy/CpxP family protein refolding chaperone [Microvirga lenta]MCB5176582.1 Spy/CpxP family protein refolding chaperone [Microvirga lenta]